MLIMNITLGILLIICSVTDILTKQVRPLLLVLFAAAGIIMYIVIRPVGLADEAAGMLTGAVFILVWYFTGGRIGLGDALLMIVTGIFLGGKENSVLIMGAMFLAALYSAGLMVFRKADKNREIAFIPFIFMSYMGMVII